jgi:hypothetical protein
MVNHGVRSSQLILANIYALEGEIEKALKELNLVGKT